MCKQLFARAAIAILVALVGISAGCSAPSEPAATVPGPSVFRPGAILMTPSGAIVGTSVIFKCIGATDSDDNPLTFVWDFGDGGTSTGAQTSHTYTSQGDFTAKMTVNNGHGQTATVSMPLAVKNLTSSFWGGPSAPHPLIGGHTGVSITQSGFILTGTYRDDSYDGTVAGTIGATGTVTFTVTIDGLEPFTFTGTAGPGVTTLLGIANGSGFFNAEWLLRKF